MTATLLCIPACTPVSPAAAGAGAPPVGELAGWFDLKLDSLGLDSPFMQGLTSRHVNGSARLLSLGLHGKLFEYAPAPYKTTQTKQFRVWDLSKIGGALSSFDGIWFEEAKDRLWVVSTQDYTETEKDAHIFMLTLHDDLTVSTVGHWSVNGVPEKRLYGGCQPSPLKQFAYICGWGGYTSLMEASGACSVGPTMYGIAEPTSLPAGHNLSATAILDVHHPNPQNKSQTETRGARLTIPVNYFDGGDHRPNGRGPGSNSPRPTDPPLANASWQSPRPDGKGWMVWGDSYYNTGMTVPNGFMAIASLCKGDCWYCGSSLCADSRQFELHFWPTASLDGTGGHPWQEPAMLIELKITPAKPIGQTRGDGPMNNLDGATIIDNKMYAAGWATGATKYTNRVYVWDMS